MLVLLLLGACIGPVLGASTSFRGNAGDPLTTQVDLPSHVKLGEIFPVKITIKNNIDKSLYLVIAVMQDILAKTSEEAGERGRCLGPNDTIVEVFKLRPQDRGLVNLTVGVGAKRQQNPECDEGDQTDSDLIYIHTVNMVVGAEGRKAEKLFSKYACGLDIRDGRDSFVEWEFEVPPNAVNGSVKTSVSVANTFFANIMKGLESPLIHGRGDLVLLRGSISAYLLTLPKYKNPVTVVTSPLKANVEKAEKELRKYRLEDGSYTTYGDWNRASSSWMTAYVLSTGVIDNGRELTETANWLINHQNIDEDGCMKPLGTTYHDYLKNDTKDSHVLFTSLAAIAMNIGLNAGLVNIPVTRTTTCLMKHVTKDPYLMAVKSYALACMWQLEGEIIMKKLFQKVKSENETHISWGLDEKREIQVASYAGLAIMKNFSGYKSKLPKLIRSIAERANTNGGFTSVFDTMIAQRALIAYEAERKEFDLEVTVEAKNVSKTLTLSEGDWSTVKTVDIPILPTSVNINLNGSGCGLFQGAVEYDVLGNYTNEAFSLLLFTQATGCENESRGITFCTAYLLNQTSNLVAIEVDLISGYSPSEDDLKAIVNLPYNGFQGYKLKGDKIIFFVEGLSAEDSCVHIPLKRDFDVENPKPGVVVVYDYYQPEFATGKTYSFELC